MLIGVGTEKRGEERNREVGEMPKNVGRREKSGRKCREEGENGMLGVRGDGSGVIFFNLHDGKGWGTGNVTSAMIPLGPLGLPWSDLTV